MEKAPDYREMLRGEFETRTARNSGYSMRAFARDLKLTSARLSEILSGKKGLSRDAAAELAGRLSWSRTEAEFFCDLVEAKHARSGLAREIAQKRVAEKLSREHGSKHLNVEAFRIVSDWYHFAILAALKLPTCKGTASDLALILGLTETQASTALGRLERVGLVDCENGFYRPAEDAAFSPDGVPSDAIRKAHEQLLNKAIDALHFQPLQERDFYSYLMPIRGADLPEIRKRTRDFIHGIRDEFAFRPDVDRVVSLSHQLFNLSKIESKK